MGNNNDKCEDCNGSGYEWYRSPSGTMTRSACCLCKGSGKR